MLARNFLFIFTPLLFVFLGLSAAPGPLLAQQTETILPSAAPAGEADPYDSLLYLLEDETLRERLVDDLRQLRSEETASGDAAAPASPPAEEPVSLSRQVAQITRDTAQSAFGWLQEAIEGIENLRFAEAASEERLKELGAAAFRLGATILVTVVSFLLLLRGARRIYGRLGQRAAAHPGFALRATAVTLASIIDAFAVILAWLVGYLFALFAIGEPGEMNVRHALFLNIFLLIEIAKMLLRLVLSPNATALRPLPINDEDAAYWYTWLSRVFGVLGYGLLFIVPMVRSNISVEAGQALSVLIGATALIMAVLLVLQNRIPIQHWLERRAQHSEVTFIRSLLIEIGRASCR